MRKVMGILVGLFVAGSAVAQPGQGSCNLESVPTALEICKGNAEDNRESAEDGEKNACPLPPLNGTWDGGCEDGYYCDWVEAMNEAKDDFIICEALDGENCYQDYCDAVNAATLAYAGEIGQCCVTTLSYVDMSLMTPIELVEYQLKLKRARCFR